MQIRQGVDIVSVERLEQVAKRHGERFLNRIFTAEERSYCETKRYKYEHYAARFAAKEAMMKAMEIRRKDRLRFREIEVRRRATGKPEISVSPESSKRFGLPKGARVELSMAHEREFAVSFVVLLLP
ncbi:MAG: holo-ACP synthase [Candidatus Omnitrophica bacterium]|nr:holo-ACP synthase [Candidatus Omnitrophota bacterium]